MSTCLLICTKKSTQHGFIRDHMIDNIWWIFKTKLKFQFHFYLNYLMTGQGYIIIQITCETYERFVDFVFNIACWCLWALNKKTFFNTNIKITYLLDLLLKRNEIRCIQISWIDPTHMIIWDHMIIDFHGNVHPTWLYRTTWLLGPLEYTLSSFASPEELASTRAAGTF